MNKSNNITREEMWAKQCLSATDIDYAVWERDKSILHQLSKICHNCTFVVDVYKCNYTYASSNFVDLLGYDSHKIETLEKQGDYLESRIHPDVLLDEMDRVINAAKLGRPASMILKNNSISDRDIILKLEEASCAGVRIDMIVRGICCVRAEVPGKTENLHIRSLVGRYLEHGRIYSFYDGVTTRIYIASGDFLTRNTECRVEVGVRVEDPVLIQKLSDILQLQLRDNVNAREMRADGSYQKVKAAPGEPLVNGQMDMYDLLRDDWLARDTASAAEPEQPEPKAPERPSEPETRPEPVQVAEQPAEPAKQLATVKAAPAPAVQSAPAPHVVDRAERHGHSSLFQRLHDWLRR